MTVTLIGVGSQLWRKRRRYGALVVAAAATIVLAAAVLAGALALLAGTGPHPHPVAVVALALLGLAAPVVAWRSWRAGRRSGWPTAPVALRSSAAALAVGLPVLGLLSFVWLLVGLASL
ncbi:MAG TPA: hypothetical protein VKG43_03890 [Acidimicrobiales bacterium]|nr:hypothetical protein [Acidimicrobiales bacterium]